MGRAGHRTRNCVSRRHTHRLCRRTRLPHLSPEERYSPGLIAQRMYTGVDFFPLVAVPLFVFAGFLMETGGISRRIVALALSIVGPIRGSLGMGAVVSEMIFSGISGSSIADASAMGAILIPTMGRPGMTPKDSTAIVSAATGMGILVPPCMAMVVLGGMGQISIGALFAAGFLPAAVMALSICVWIYMQATERTAARRPRGLLAGRVGGPSRSPHPAGDAGHHLRRDTRRGHDRHRGRGPGRPLWFHRVGPDLPGGRLLPGGQNAGEHRCRNRGNPDPHRDGLDSSPGSWPISRFPRPSRVSCSRSASPRYSSSWPASPSSSGARSWTASRRSSSSTRSCSRSRSNSASILCISRWSWWRRKGLGLCCLRSGICLIVVCGVSKVSLSS